MAKEYYAVIIVFDEDPNNPGHFKSNPTRTNLNSGLKEMYNTPLDVIDDDGNVTEPALNNVSYISAQNTDLKRGETTIVRTDRRSKMEFPIATVRFDDQFFKKYIIDSGNIDGKDCKQLIYTGVIYSESDVDSLRTAINYKIPFKENDPYRNREFILEGDGKKHESEPNS